MTVTNVALVALGAAAGAPARWYVDVVVQRRWLPAFPWGTFAVNVTGSALLGFLIATWSTGSAAISLLGIGFCGALTTFSSFAWESHRLAEDGTTNTAFANVIATPVLCCAAAAVGWCIGS
jgi:CrcB protein